MLAVKTRATAMQQQQLLFFLHMILQYSKVQGDPRKDTHWEGLSRWRYKEVKFCQIKLSM